MLAESDAWSVLTQVTAQGQERSVMVLPQANKALVV